MYRGQHDRNCVKGIVILWNFRSVLALYLFHQILAFLAVPSGIGWLGEGCCCEYLIVGSLGLEGALDGLKGTLGDGGHYDRERVGHRLHRHGLDVGGEARQEIGGLLKGYPVVSYAI